MVSNYGQMKLASNTMVRVGVLALQGAVSEHAAMLEKAGMGSGYVRRPADLAGLDGLIIPGGESTAISRLIRQAGLFDPIRAFAATRPVLGTCAGLILCGREAHGSGGAMPGERESRRPDGSPRLEPLGLMDITSSRNGFGRQVDSFETELEAEGLGMIPAVFIRAPYIERLGPNVRCLAKLDGKVVMAESATVLVTAFHPELTDDVRVFRYFGEKIARAAG